MVAICEGRVHLVHRHCIHARHLVLLLPLHPTVLEPDLDLPLGQAERVRYLDPENGQLEQLVFFSLFWRFSTFKISVMLSRSYLRLRVRYLLKWNSFSSSRVW